MNNVNLPHCSPNECCAASAYYTQAEQQHHHPKCAQHSRSIHPPPRAKPDFQTNAPPGPLGLWQGTPWLKKSAGSLVPIIKQSMGNPLRTSVNLQSPRIWQGMVSATNSDLPPVPLDLAGGLAEYRHDTPRKYATPPLITQGRPVDSPSNHRPQYLLPQSRITSTRHLSHC